MAEQSRQYCYRCRYSGAGMLCYLYYGVFGERRGCELLRQERPQGRYRKYGAFAAHRRLHLC